MVKRLAELQPHLSSLIFGQDDAISTVVPLLQSGELGLRETGRPKASFLLVGPTGVGKTELALEFSRYLFGSGRVVRLDMSEFQGTDGIRSLLGTASCEGLFEKGFQESGGVGTLLFDEVEKAETGLLDLLLQILDAARITLGNSRTLDLSQYYVVLTSNLASQALLESQNCSAATLARFMEVQARKAFRPETFARIDKMVVFEHLDHATLIRIGRAMLDREIGRFASLGYSISLPESEIDQMLRSFSGTKYGARPMRRLITEALQQKVVEQILSTS